MDRKQTLSNYIVVTGTSSGIGAAIATQLVHSGYQVFGTVRNLDDGNSLRAELGEAYLPVRCDVANQAQVASAADEIAERVGDDGLCALINNAGMAITGPLQHLDLDELRRQFEVNLFGQLAVTQSLLPLLGAQAQATHPPGRIVNISSIGTSVIFPFLVPYAASKCALEALSEGLRRELLLYGIDVIVIRPGVVATPIWTKQSATDATQYDGTGYREAYARAMEATSRLGQSGMPMERLTRIVHQAIASPKPRACYTIPSRPFSPRRLMTRLPTRWMDRAIGRRLGLVFHR